MLLFCTARLLAVGDNTFTKLAETPDPSNTVMDLSYPLQSLSGTVYWSEQLQAGGVRLDSSAGVVNTDPRTDSEAGNFPIGAPEDVLGSTVLNQGAIFVSEGSGGFLEAPALFFNGATLKASYLDTFPGITSDDNLQVGAGSLDQDGSIVFLAWRTYDMNVQAICRSSGGTITILAEAGVTAVPGKPGAKFSVVASPTANGGVVMFYGESGVYRGIFEIVNGKIIPVVDNETKFPPTGQFPSILGPSTVSFSNEGPDLAVAFGTGGVYKRLGGKWATVAKPYAAIPDGNGIFYSMADPAIHQGRVAFLGFRANPFALPLQTGVYVEVANGFATVINESDDFGGNSPQAFFPGQRWWNGSTIAVLAQNLSQNWAAICQATVAVHPLTVQDDTVVIRGTKATVIPVLDNDTGPWGTTLQVTAVSGGTTGQPTLKNGVVSYKPGPSFTGSDSFTYTVSAGDATATGTVTISDPFLNLHGSFTQVVINGSGGAVGSLSATVTPLGALTGKLTLGSTKVAVHGNLTDAAAFGEEIRVDSIPFSLSLTFSQNASGQAQVQGTIGNLSAPLTINAAPLFVTSAAAGIQPGAYTVLISPDADTTHPQGYGWLKGTLNAKGTLTLAGKLDDGTAVSIGTALRGDGTAPVYELVYKHPVGSVGGTLLFSAANSNGVTGSFAWNRPPQTAPGSLYPQGFASTLTVAGALFTAPHTGTHSLSYTGTPAQGQLTLTDAAVGTVSATLQVSSSDLCSPPSSNPNAVAVTLNRKTGVFTGSFKPTGATAALHFTGVQVQGTTNQAAGLFITASDTGSAVFQPQ